MRIFYIDESGSENNKIYTAFGVDDNVWLDTLDKLVYHRRDLYNRYGLYVRKEIHTYRFATGHGHYAKTPIFLHDRIDIYKEFLVLLSNLSGIHVINAFGKKGDADILLERLLNRINTNVKKENQKALLIFDNGENANIISKVRKMRRFNYIPSAYGDWGMGSILTASGNSIKNIQIADIVEDPNFRDSKESLFIQCADMIAYALLRKECPNKKSIETGVINFFPLLRPILVLEANRKDEFGIVKVY